LSGASRPSDASRWAARHNSRPVVAAYRRTRCGTTRASLFSIRLPKV
jgi:hypothetical protein